MGQKVHPLANRLGFVKDWTARWFTKKNFAETLQEDLLIRNYIKKRYYRAGIAKVQIERAGKYIRINIQTARPGIIIGKKGADAEKLREDLEAISSKKVFINIVPIKKPQIEAQLLSESVAVQLEKKMPFRRVLKRIMARAMSEGAQGIKIAVAGRLGGAEIARTEWMKEGRIPLGTFKANIEYGFSEANTSYGKIGVKVWVYKDETSTDKEQVISDKVVIGKGEKEKKEDPKVGPELKGENITEKTETEEIDEIQDNVEIEKADVDAKNKDIENTEE